MLDIKLIRSNPELVKENIKKKFQDREAALGGSRCWSWTPSSAPAQDRGERAARSSATPISKEIGTLMKPGQEG